MDEHIIDLFNEEPLELVRLISEVVWNTESPYFGHFLDLARRQLVFMSVDS